MVSKGFFKNINLQYNLNGRNSIVTTDSLFFKPQMFRDAKLAFSTVFRWLLTSNYLNILALQHQ
jgi:hypothetical protein